MLGQQYLKNCEERQKSIQENKWLLGVLADGDMHSRLWSAVCSRLAAVRAALGCRQISGELVVRRWIMELSLFLKALYQRCSRQVSYPISRSKVCFWSKVLNNAAENWKLVKTYTYKHFLESSYIYIFNSNSAPIARSKVGIYSQIKSWLSTKKYCNCK